MQAQCHAKSPIEPKPSGSAVTHERPALRIRTLGQAEYRTTLRQMREYNRQRDLYAADEIWLLQHGPVYTLGLAGRVEHILTPGTIPVVQSDRGGQATYHGPGQLVVYLMLDLRRYRLQVKRYVNLLEQAVIDFLAEQGVVGERRVGAPGVYVAGAKIAALGIRIRRQCSYHGLALNVDMDLKPYQGIVPCNDPQLVVTQLAELGVSLSCVQVGRLLCQHLLHHLGRLAPAGWSAAVA